MELSRILKAVWVVSFTKAAHAFTPTHMELLAFYIDLQLLHDRRLMSLKLKTDSTEIIQLFERNIYPAYNNITFECRCLLRILEKPVVQHNFREENKVAYVLSKMGSKQSALSYVNFWLSL